MNLREESTAIRTTEEWSRIWKQDFLWQLRKNFRFTMTTVLCAGKGWTLQENYPVAISFIILV